MPSKSADEEREFITLQLSNTGFVVYGIGAGAARCTYRGEPLMNFLEKLWKKMGDIKDELNESWQKIDRENPENPRNQPVVERYLSVGAWAYALAVELQPFTPQCVSGPTDPLRHFYIKPLEEIFTKCFAAAHLFGSADQSMVGLHGLVTDFESNGGIKHGTGETGNGFFVSLMTYLVAYLTPTNREPVVYRKFGELMDALAGLAESRYPKIAAELAAKIQGFLESRNHGFGRTEIASPAKTAMMKELTATKNRLLKVVLPDKNKGQKAAA